MYSQRSARRTTGEEKWRMGQRGGVRAGRESPVQNSCFFLYQVPERERIRLARLITLACLGRASFCKFLVSLGLTDLECLDVCSPTALARGGRTGLGLRA